jgi:hypothetical protein
MHTRYIKTFVSLAVIALLAVACGDDLTETNINPNEALKAQPDYLLTNVIKSSVDTYWGVDGNANATLLFIQHFAKIQYTDQDRYRFTNTSFESIWKTYYSVGLADLAEITRLAEQSGNDNYKGVALILRSWLFANLTDLYGAIPYRHSIQIATQLSPAYDSQEVVYTGILDDLKTGVDLLDPKGGSIAGDILYGGNIDHWIKFGNALRLRYALRIADRAEAKAREVITDLQDAPIISNNSEHARLVYKSSPNQNPIAANFETRDDYRISQTLVETLRGLNDPRLPVFAAKTDTITTGVYVGLPNGLTSAAAADIGFNKTSKPGAYFLRSEAPGVVLSYAEVLFNQAEAVQRGFIATGDAAALYEQAITASLQQFGVTDETVIDNYLAQPDVQYNAANYRESIGTQKWISLFGQGTEAFSEWRRLDYPALPPAVSGVLGGKMPVRLIYPGSEQSLNGKSYRDAVNVQGTDGLTTRLWFDKE